MASTITAPTYDPVNTANSLAEKYVMARRQILDAQGAAARATEKGLTELGSAMTAFQTSMAAITGLNKSLYAQAATFSDTTVGSATAGPTAAPGSYAFFVAKLATTSQVSFAGLTDDAGVSGTLDINMGGALAFQVNMGAADTDANGILSTRELAAAINGNSGNTSLVTASIITTGSGSELVLTAKSTGAASAITLDTTNVSAASSLKDANGDVARKRTLVAAQDAEIHIGAENGTLIKQATNTFTNIDGVKMTFTKAQAPGSAPVTIEVGADTKNTTANVQGFIDAYNKLKGVLNKLTDSGDPSKGTAGGSFANDGAIRALNERLVSLLRPSTTGDTLAAFGIIASRDGTLELNNDRLQRQLALKPTGLDVLIGSSSASAPSGIAGTLDKFIKSWSNTADGRIKQRKEQTSDLQSTLADRQAFLEIQQEAAYNRYLRQFTALQSLQGAMNNNLSMFDAMFGNNND